MNQTITMDDQLLYRSSIERLEAIRRRHYPEQGRYKQLYAEVTDCLRQYLNQQYELDMKTRTVEELERVLRRLRGPADLFNELRKLFEAHEKLQRAEWLPSKQEAQQVPQRAQDLLYRLAPAEIRSKVNSQNGKQSQNRDEVQWTMPEPSKQKAA